MVRINRFSQLNLKIEIQCISKLTCVGSLYSGERQKIRCMRCILRSEFVNLFSTLAVLKIRPFSAWANLRSKNSNLIYFHKLMSFDLLMTQGGLMYKV